MYRERGLHGLRLRRPERGRIGRDAGGAGRCERNDVRRLAKGCGIAAAFTLIELLVAVAILGLVTTVVGACLAGGIRAWESARRFGEMDADAVLALERLERDLRNAIPFADEPWMCRPHALSLIGEGFAPGEDGPEARPLPRRIEYAFEPDAGLLRRESPVQGGGAAEPAERLADDVAEMTFEYVPFPDEAGGPAAGTVTVRMTLLNGATWTREIVSPVRHAWRVEAR